VNRHNRWLTGGGGRIGQRIRRERKKKSKEAKIEKTQEESSYPYHVAGWGIKRRDAVRGAFSEQKGAKAKEKHGGQFTWDWLMRR